MAKRLTEDEIKRIKKLRSKGLSYLTIAELIGRSEYSVRKYAQEEKKKEENLIGKKFNRLTVIEYDHSVKGHKYYKCQCECGNTRVVLSSNLKNGRVKSCGCLLKEKREKVKEQNKKQQQVSKKKTTRQYKTRNNKGGVYYFQPDEIQLKHNYEVEGNKAGGEIKKYKLSPEELAAYLKNLKTKEVQRRER